jgi:fibrillarin-like rRNA methylase
MKDKFEWDEYKSKWKAAIERGIDLELKGDENILYLGASSGTTVGHLCERTKGIIFAVEKAYKMAISLVKLCEKRVNIAPIFSDAHDVEYIRKMINKNSFASTSANANAPSENLKSRGNAHDVEYIRKMINKNSFASTSANANAPSENLKSRGNAHDVEYMKEKIGNERIDILFCDIPSGDQVDILIKAAEIVDKDCKILFTLKTQSISQGEPKDVFKKVKKKLGLMFEIIEERNLEPYHKKHWFFVLKKK